jgi:general stress protein 26
MPDVAEIEAKLWKSLKSDRTLMLGLAGADRALAQPMTAQLEEAERGPIWTFTSKDTDLAQTVGAGHEAVAYFASKGHDLFAAIEGRLGPDNDPATIDRLWSPFVEAWFEGGKSDPKLLLLRFDPREAQIWLNEHSLFAGVKLLMGSDPKKDYADKTAQVRLG